MRSEWTPTIAVAKQKSATPHFHVLPLVETVTTRLLCRRRTPSMGMGSRALSASSCHPERSGLPPRWNCFRGAQLRQGTRRSDPLKRGEMGYRLRMIPLVLRRTACPPQLTLVGGKRLHRLRGMHPACAGRVVRSRIYSRLVCGLGPPLYPDYANILMCSATIGF